MCKNMKTIVSTSTCLVKCSSKYVVTIFYFVEALSSIFPYARPHVLRLVAHTHDDRCRSCMEFILDPNTILSQWPTLVVAYTWRRRQSARFHHTQMHHKYSKKTLRDVVLQRYILDLRACTLSEVSSPKCTPGHEPKKMQPSCNRVQRALAHECTRATVERGERE